MRSSNCSLIFCDDSVPSAWVTRKSVIGNYDGKYFERELCVDGEIKLFKVSRNYKELVERLSLIHI